MFLHKQKREQHENQNYIWFETRVEGTTYSKGVDIQGRQIIPNKYYSINYLYEVDETLYFNAVDQYNNVALYNNRGKEIVPCSRGYQLIEYLPYVHYDKNGYGIWRALFTFSKDGKFGVVEGYTGTVLLDPIYDTIKSYTKNHFNVIKDGVTISVSYNLEQINKFKNRERSTLSGIEKLTRTNNVNGHTYIETIDYSKPDYENVGIIFNGKQIIPSIYRNVTYEAKCNGLHYFIAQLRNEHTTECLYNSLGKLIAKYDKLNTLLNFEKNINDTYVLFKFEKDGKKGVIDGVTGDIIIESIYDDIDNYDEGKFKVTLNNNDKYIAYGISKLKNKNRNNTNNTPKCYACGGSGWYDPTIPGIVSNAIVCQVCGGTGNYVPPSNNSGSYQPIQQNTPTGRYITTTERCIECGGTGKITKRIWNGNQVDPSTVQLRCTKCHGKGTISNREYVVE